MLDRCDEGFADSVKKRPLGTSDVNICVGQFSRKLSYL